MGQGFTLRFQDIKSAYLTANLDLIVYIKTPPEFKQFCNVQTPFMRIKKALYGLPQAGRCFWIQLCKDLQEFGFIPCTTDNCFFRYQSEKGGEMYIALVVDDLLQSTNDPAIFESFDQFMHNKKKYEITIDK